MNSDILERHYSNIFTLPKKRFTLALGVVAIAIGSILYGTARAFFATRYLFLALSFIILIYIFGRVIKLAFNGKRIFFLALLILIFIEIFDFIVFHLGLPYLISLTPAIISSFLTIILYFSSEADEKTVFAISFGMVLLIYPLNYLFAFDAPSRVHIYILTAIYVLLAFLGTVTGSLYIRFLDIDLGFNVKNFLRAFILFWLTSNPQYLDERLEYIGIRQKGWLACLSLGKTRIVTQTFHEGPFRNVGGSTIVPKILSQEDTLYLHTATDHEKDLVSAHEVDSLLRHLTCDGVVTKAMKPYKICDEGFTITVFPFDKVRLAIVSGNETIDDLTSEVQDFADTMGTFLVVDAHNAYKKGYNTTQDQIERLKKMITQTAVHNTPLSKLSYSFSKNKVTSTNICDYVALLLLDYEDVKYALFMIDSNNIKKTFRNDIEQFLSKKGFYPVIVSTDNHLKTGLPPKLEYHPAGEDESDVLAVFNFLNQVDYLHISHNAHITYARTRVEMNVIGNKFLSDLEQATVKLAKKSIYLFIGILFLQLLVAIGLGILLA